MSTNTPTSFEFFESTFMYFQNSFDILDMSKVTLNIDNNQLFEIFFCYSIDGINYSEFLKQEEYLESITNDVPIYLCIYFQRYVIQNLQTPKSIENIKNINPTQPNIVISRILYNNEAIDFNTLQLKTVYDIVNEYPRWNLYDNQDVTINRWLSQCNAVSEMYGHTCIYFKTEPVENEILHTFANYVIRNVIAIKKLKILFPNNELPQDRNIYTDWDMPLQDEIVVHIITQKFERAFGTNKIPSSKDYLYLPIINKLFRVSTMQPKTGFMGKIGWWETYLSKYEEDETVILSDELKNSLTILPEFDQAIETIEDELGIEDENILNTILTEIDDYKNDTLFTSDTIDKDTVEEKKLITENFTNKLEDSTFHISLKETEALREFYDRRLNIVSVNPDTNISPITMYNCAEIPKRTIALQYNLTDYTIKNKFSLTLNIDYSITFNYILVNNFVGEVIDILSSNVSIFTIKNNRNSLQLIDNRNQITFDVNYKFSIKELYQINLNFIKESNQFVLKIFTLVNKEKTLEYQNIYIITNVISNNAITITKLDLFGGNFLINDLFFNIDDKQILSDYCNPILEMNKF